MLYGICKNKFKIASYEQTTEKAEIKMGLEGNFTFDFTAAFELDPTSIWYQENTVQTVDLYLD